MNREAELIAMLLEMPVMPGTFAHEIKHPSLTASEQNRERERKQKKLLESHNKKHERWSALSVVRKAFGREHPIYTDRIMWEMHVCRIRECREWFEGLDQFDRIRFCDWCRAHRD